jgi:hypothetical protein
MDDGCSPRIGVRDLADVIDAGKLTLAYQPKIATGEGVEALAPSDTRSDTAFRVYSAR